MPTDATPCILFSVGWYPQLLRASVGLAGQHARSDCEPERSQTSPPPRKDGHCWVDWAWAPCVGHLYKCMYIQQHHLNIGHQRSGSGRAKRKGEQSTGGNSIKAPNYLGALADGRQVPTHGHMASLQQKSPAAAYPTSWRNG